MHVRSHFDDMPQVTGAISALDTARDAWLWWTAELMEMVPSGLRNNRSGKRPLVDIRIKRDSTEIERVVGDVGERFVDPRPIHELDDQAWSEIAELAENRAVTVVLSAPDIYPTSLKLPRQARGRLRQAIQLRMGEISPLEPALVHWAIGRVAVDGDRLDVTIVMAKLSRLAELTTLFSHHDLPPPSIVAGYGTDQRTPLQGSASAGRMINRSWLLAAGLIASIPLSILFLASILVWSNQRALDAVASTVQATADQDNRLRQDQKVRNALVGLAHERPASQIFDDLAEHLPAEASLASIEQSTTGIVLLTVVAKDPEAIRDILSRDPLLRLDEIDEAPLDNGKMKLTYRGGLR